VTDDPSAFDTLPDDAPNPHGPGGALARAALVLGVVLLPLGWLAPMLETRRFFFVRDSYSLIETVAALAQSGETILAVTVGVFSIALPGLKALTLVWLNVAGGRGVRPFGLFLLEHLGQWSMMEVFIAALIVVSLSGAGLASAITLPGLYIFAASALLLMLSSGRVARDLRR